MKEGNVWVFLRGLVREVGHWGNFIEQFQAKTGESCYAIDLPGAGEYYQETAPLKISDYVEFLRDRLYEKLREEDVGKNINLFAISLGAMIASEWVHRHPDEVKKVILVNASFGNLSPAYERLRWQSYPLLATIVFTTNLEARERQILNLVSNHKALHDRLTDEWVDIQRRHPVSIHNTIRQLTAAVRYQLPQQKPHVPILIVRSLGDHMVNSECSRRLHEYWHGDIVTHSWGGHELVLDDPKWVLEQVALWLMKVDKKLPLPAGMSDASGLAK